MESTQRSNIKNFQIHNFLCNNCAHLSVLSEELHFPVVLCMERCRMHDGNRRPGSSVFWSLFHSTESLIKEVLYIEGEKRWKEMARADRVLETM